MCIVYLREANLFLATHASSPSMAFALSPQNTYPSELVWLFVTLLVLLLFGRALYVVPFALLHNMWSPEQLAPRDIVVIW